VYSGNGGMCLCICSMKFSVTYLFKTRFFFDVLCFNIGLFGRWMTNDTRFRNMLKCNEIDMSLKKIVQRLKYAIMYFG
jgi:hypothetical protein